jgi:arylformamidase
MKLIDITHPLSNATAPWPGDTPFRFEFVCRLSTGASANVGKFTSGIHSGTHMDAPLHYRDTGASIDQLDPGLLIGPARVFAAPDTMVITRAHFAGLDGRATPRVLVRTNHCDDKTKFPARIPLLAPDVPAWLGAQGVRVVGLDLPSVDQIDDPSMQIHHRLDAANILILENLDLRAAAPGVYELIALPLKLAGAEGSPIRAVLRTWDAPRG